MLQQRILTVNDTDILAMSCAYDSTPFALGDAVVQCPGECGRWYHVACWKAYGNHCAWFGCKGAGAVTESNGEANANKNVLDVQATLAGSRQITWDASDINSGLDEIEVTDNRVKFISGVVELSLDEIPDSEIDMVLTEAEVESSHQMRPPLDIQAAQEQRAGIDVVDFVLTENEVMDFYTFSGQSHLTIEKLNKQVAGKFQQSGCRKRIFQALLILTLLGFAFLYWVSNLIKSYS